ncbi:MAG: hypothetical protein ACHQIO_19450, partial [Nevskiales bacterium]
DWLLRGARLLRLAIARERQHPRRQHDRSGNIDAAAAIGPAPLALRRVPAIRKAAVIERNRLPVASQRAGTGGNRNLTGGLMVRRT